MKKTVTLLGLVCASGLLVALAMYLGLVPMMGLSAILEEDDVHDWQFIEPAALSGVMDGGVPLTASYAQKLEEKGEIYAAFEAYRDELNYHIATNAHAQVLVLAPKLQAVVQKLKPPPIAPPEVAEGYDTARKSLDEARTLKDLATAASNFRFCAQISPWIPDLYHHLSVAESAADELRAAERHLQVYLRLKPEAASRADIQRFQASLQKSIAATHAWENSLGLRFVPISDTTVRFCIWETRVKDYSLFVELTGHPWSKGGISDTEPASMLNLYDAAAFCGWLTQKERRDGVIGEHDYYRLPTHEEWTLAVGAGPEEEPDVPAPNRFRTFPWGEDWPPPPGAGNLKGVEVSNGIEGYEDAFPALAPVGSFDPNLNGLHDMAGNVREWCADSMAETAAAVFTAAETQSVTAMARGGSFNSASREELGSLEKRALPALEALYEDTGFRCVLAKEEAVLALHEVQNKPVKGGKTLSGDFEPGTRFTGPEPLLQVSCLRAMRISTSGKHPKISLEFESINHGDHSTSVLENERRWFLCVATNPKAEGATGMDFLAPSKGVKLEEKRLTLTFSTQEEFNRARAILEKRIVPRHLFEVPHPRLERASK
jgi:hypothetical protein